MADPESHRIRPGLTGDARGVTPAVGKTLEIGLVVLYVALVTTVLLAGVVPEYRAAAGAEVGDRVLVAASQDVERAVPPDGTDTTVERTVQLPATIAGTGYRIRADGRRRGGPTRPRRARRPRHGHLGERRRNDRSRH